MDLDWDYPTSVKLAEILGRQWARDIEAMSRGDYDGHFPHHDWVRSGDPKYKDRFVPTADFGVPVWDGQETNRTLLVNAEFGMGDTIQFFRFIPEAKSRVGRLVLRCDSDFKPLFRRVDVVGSDDPLPEFDKVIHMMALPRAMGILKRSIDGRPYLAPNTHYAADQRLYVIRSAKFTKIGVCWQGNPFNPRDEERSVPTELLQKLFIKPGMRFFNLVKHVESPVNFFPLASMMSNWNETAYAVQAMDLVITVDTAIAHLAGAMGKPTWLLLPKPAEWRWGQEGDSTFWYKTVRLFRCDDSGWAGLMDRVATELGGLAVA